MAKSSFLPSQVTLSTRTIKDAPTAKVVDDLINAVNGALNDRVSAQQPFSPLLTSPSGSIFQLIVRDDGSLGTQLVRTP
jgi:hypothetical protein